jgi:hypothetical protein
MLKHLDFSLLHFDIYSLFNAIVMLEKSFGLLFFLKRPKNYDGGMMPVYLRITVDGLEKELSLKRNWEPSRWNTKANRASGSKEDSKKLNDYLNTMQAKAYDARETLILKGKVITAVAIRDLLSGEEQRKWMLMQLFSAHNRALEELVGDGAAPGTLTNFKASYNHTLNFLKAEYGTEDINILSLDLECIKRLYHWYRAKRSKS